MPEEQTPKVCKSIQEGLLDVAKYGVETYNQKLKGSSHMASTANMPLHRQLQLHPSLYCLMATDDQVATILDLVADAIEHEGLSGQTVEWLRCQARAAFGVNRPSTTGKD